MTTKHTDELRPGDRVKTPYGFRVVRSLSPRTGQRFAALLEVPSSDTPDRITAHKTTEWEVQEPEPTPQVRAVKLDLAVQRAQELADQYPSGEVFPDSYPPLLQHFRDLLALFRAAR